MRPFEILLTLLSLTGSLALFLRLRPPALPWVYSAMVLLAFALHLLREGAHWQLLYLYAALLLVGFFLFRSATAPYAALTALTLTAASLTLAWALPLFRLPLPTGPYAVGTRTVFLTDPETHRELVTQLWYPAEPLGPFAAYTRAAEIKPLFRYFALIRTNAHLEAPLQSDNLPLLLLNPSWDGRRTQETFLAEELASQGYVVASLDHPGNAARVQLADGQIVRSTMTAALNTPSGPQAIINVWNTELAAWTRDDQFLLRALTTQLAWLSPHLDPGHVGAVGHSFGGAASLALLGLDAPGTPTVRAAVNMDGWTFAGLDHRTTQPAMLLYSAPPAATNPHPETLPTSSYQDDQLERIDRILVDANLARYGGSKAYVQGSQHADFTDANLISPVQRLTFTGPIAPERMQQLTRGLVLNFFDHTLRNQPWNPALVQSPELRWTARPR